MTNFAVKKMNENTTFWLVTWSGKVGLSYEKPVELSDLTLGFVNTKWLLNCSKIIFKQTLLFEVL